MNKEDILIDTYEKWEEEYEKPSQRKYIQVKGLSRLLTYQSMEYLKELLSNKKYYCEALEDTYVHIRSHIITIEENEKILQQRINKTIEYIENDIPYLEEPDKEFERCDGTTYITKKEYDTSILLNILRGENNEI